jgi:GNAT superfamily N-acetyltransferase
MDAPATYTISTLAEKPHLEPQIELLSRDAWPPFLRHGNSIHWYLLFETFAPYQLLFCEPDDKLIAVGHTAPLAWNGQAQDLPATIEDILLRAEQGEHSGQPANTFSALAAMIAPDRRGQNLSQAVLLAMRDLARSRGCSSLIAPVRPTWKSRYPLTPMERYVAWRRSDGAPLDPWLRVHWRLGAEQLKVEPNTLTVEGTVADWEAWTGMAFPESGAYVVPGALQPVLIDCERNVGRYEDPNVWMRHST